MDDEGVQARCVSKFRSYRPGDPCTIGKTRRAGAVGACDGRMWKTVEDKNRSVLEHWTSSVFAEGRNANLLSALGIR